MPFVALRNAVVAIILLISPAYGETALLALGDSLTAGYGLPPEQGFVPQLQAALGGSAVVINAGVSGDTTAGGLARVDWSLTPEVGAVLVNLGGNDMLRGIDPSVARANLELILQKLQARKLPILLVSLRSPGNYGSDYKTAFDAIYGELAQDYGAVLFDDYFAPLMLSPGVLDPTLMQADGIHPNAAGVTKVVSAMAPKVQELLAQVAR